MVRRFEDHAACGEPGKRFLDQVEREIRRTEADYLGRGEELEIEQGRFAEAQTGAFAVERVEARFHVNAKFVGDCRGIPGSALGIRRGGGLSFAFLHASLASSIFEIR